MDVASSLHVLNSAVGEDVQNFGSNHLLTLHDLRGAVVFEKFAEGL
jgi:hypothetical protein